MREPRLDWRVMAGLAAWVALRLVESSSGMEVATGWGRMRAQAVSEGLAGAVLAGWALWRGQRIREWREWRALLLLAGVGVAGGLLWRPYVDGLLHVHYAKAAEQQMIWMAGALWLALLGALRWVPEETPRATVGAALAGIAGFCLLLSAEELTVRWVEVPALGLTVVQAVAMVWTWSYARRVLAARPVVVEAGCGLLVLAAVTGAAGWAMPLPIEEAHGFVWAEVWGPMGVAVVSTGAATVLWFWLLQSMELAAFAMQLVAVWVIALLWQFTMFGFLSWRVDVALALGLGGMVVALRARPEDDDPVRLGVA